MTTMETSSPLSPGLDPSITVPETHETLLDVELVMCHNPESDLWKQAEAVEAGVFIGKGYAASQAEMEADYAPYRDVSMMLVAKQGDKVVGCARVINHNADPGFKTITDAQKGELVLDEAGMALLAKTDPSSVMEVGTLSLEPEYRTKQGAEDHMVTSLYGAIYALSIMQNTPNVLASFDEDYLERFGGLYGPAVKHLGPAIDYMGSKTIPVMMNTRELEAYFASIGAQAYVDELAAHGFSMANEY